MEIREESVIYPVPSDSLLSKEEGFWRVELPLDYKNFIKKNNGGIPEKRSFHCEGHDYLMTRFLCILEEPTEHNLGIFDIDAVKTQLDERLMDDEDRLGVALLPIAVLFSGDFLCLDYRNSPSCPNVCIWDHENSDEYKPVSYPIANHFNDFLAMLTR